MYEQYGTGPLPLSNCQRQLFKQLELMTTHPVHTFVPFVVEDGGRLGLQALDLLDRLARRAAQHSGDDAPQLAARIRTRWLQELSTIVHSRQAWFITDSMSD